MAKRRRTEITIQTREFVVMHAGGWQQRAWCAECCDERIFVSPEEAAQLAGVATRLIYRCIEESRIHFLEGPQGAVLICGESLPKAIRSLERGIRK